MVASEEKESHASKQQEPQAPQEPWYKPTFSDVALDASVGIGKGRVEAHIDLSVCSVFLGAWASNAGVKTILCNRTEEIVVVSWTVGALQFKSKKANAETATSDVRIATITKLFKEALENDGWGLRCFTDVLGAILYRKHRVHRLNILSGTDLGNYKLKTFELELLSKGDRTYYP